MIMSMLRFSMTIFLIFMALLSNANARQTYREMDEPVTHAPGVVEFFSFYCPPCYQFAVNYPVIDAINKKLPDGEVVKKYHVSTMGPMGKELSEAWAIATIMGITDRVEKPLFIAVQQQHTIKSIEDIQSIFNTVGVSPQQYDNARHSMLVQSEIIQQNKMAEKFSVQNTPSLYIKGRFQMKNDGFSAKTPDEYIEQYAQQVLQLMTEHHAE